MGTMWQVGGLSSIHHNLSSVGTKRKNKVSLEGVMDSNDLDNMKS